MFIRALIFSFLFFFTLSSFADELIIEPDMGRQPILNAIDEAEHSLDLVMYGLTDTDILNALIRKANAGKTVKIILEANPYKAEKENNKTIRAFNEHDMSWLGELPAIRFIHQKTLLIDDKKVLVMTFNFTRATFSSERNFALVIDDAARVRAIAEIFNADWNHAASMNTSPDVIISPDDSRAKLLSLIEHAKHSIHVYAQSIQDYKMIGALANAAHRSVEVKIITSQPLREKPGRYLDNAGVQFHYSKKLVIHAKVFIVDGEKAVIGSINLTRTSLDNNRELAVVTRDRKVVGEIENVFQNDWDRL
jgi:phosphatidylserine/phosphatidylglycerophosphate/cardiolipin synthase-like enzyme